MNNVSQSHFVREALPRVASLVSESRVRRWRTREPQAARDARETSHPGKAWKRTCVYPNAVRGTQPVNTNREHENFRARCALLLQKHTRNALRLRFAEIGPALMRCARAPALTRWLRSPYKKTLETFTYQILSGVATHHRETYRGQLATKKIESKSHTKPAVD